MTTFTQNLPPLAVHFVWHPNDHDNIFDVISEFRRFITRDTDRPFSREINIPTFMYSSRDPNKPPNSTPKKLANKNVIFVFASGQTLISPLWVDYFNELDNSNSYSIVPVSIDEGGMKHSYSGALKNYNFIRAQNWPKNNRLESAILELSHELYRYGLNNINYNEVGKESSIKLFLSHAKKGDTGLNHAQEIKKFIDNSNMSRFFDANEISPGFKFDKEIESHIKDSTMIAIVSDAYSSRYWCQREILTAKSENRPIIVANSLEEYEDRIFPSIGNVPCVHVTAEPLAPKDILRILIAALLETIRFKYVEALLKFYQSQGWIDSKAFILCRPPEIQQVVEILSKNESSSMDSDRLHLCYPEPPLYKEETIWTDYLDITVSTPLWSSDEEQTKKYKVGISISDHLEDSYSEHHQHIDELQRLSQDLARHVLSRGHTLIYGGDLRENGFTQFILEEASVLRERLKSENFNIENHLAWPLHLTPASQEFGIKYYGLLDIKKHEIPEDIETFIIDKKIFLPPTCPENKYIWSRCLSKMRNKSIEDSDVRIFAGGKLEGYLGKMPGVLEEFLIAIEFSKPIYLAGGLGGLCKQLCHSILSSTVSKEFTEEWQIQHNTGYLELQHIAGSHKFNADYNKVEETILELNIEYLALNSGLTKDEYSRLMETPFVDEIVHLVLKGLNRLSLVK